MLTTPKRGKGSYGFDAGIKSCLWSQRHKGTDAQDGLQEKTVYWAVIPALPELCLKSGLAVVTPKDSTGNVPVP